MKESPDAILRPQQALYLERLLPPRDPLMSEMEALAAESDIPISDPEVGRILSILARARGGGRFLEIGTAIGYGALCLARGAAGATVISIDPDSERLDLARGFLERAGVAERVELLAGTALDLLPGLDGPFELAYLDAIKTEYRRCLDLIVPKLALGGLLVVDNLLWKGQVADPEVSDGADEATAALRAFNPYLMMHPQLEAVLLSVGDGLGLAVKVARTRMEMGGPF